MTLPVEIQWATLAIAMTALLWLPYIVQLIVQVGPVGALWDPTGAHPHAADWANRAKRAHYNAVENLVIFAPLAMIVGFYGLGDALTATACALYVAARLAHYLVYTFGLPVVRTLLFLVGFGCQAVLALRILGHA